MPKPKGQGKTTQTRQKRNPGEFRELISTEPIENPDQIWEIVLASMVEEREAGLMELIDTLKSGSSQEYGSLHEEVPNA